MHLHRFESQLTQALKIASDIHTVWSNMSLPFKVHISYDSVSAGTNHLH